MRFTLFFTSPIGRKIIMSLTGLFLCSFVVAHLTGNLQVFKQDGGLAFNQYTVFMTTHPAIITLSYMTYASILIHAISGAAIEARNRKARGVAYFVRPKSSPWYSRRMLLLGSIVLIYLAIHLGNFWYAYKFGDISYKRYTVNQELGNIIRQETLTFSFHPKTKLQETIGPNGEKVITVRDLYSVVVKKFSVWWIVLIYIIGVTALAYHLIHGFQAAFRSLGLHHKGYLKNIRNIGIGLFGIVVPGAFLSMPLYFFILSLCQS